jgi:cardiolipin synthase
MYTWADDRVGRRIAEAVRTRAVSGLPILVHVDALGSAGSGDLMTTLEGAGVEVRWYHPLAPWTPAWYPNRRNHRKIVLLDGEVAFIGGRNFSETYSEEFLGDEVWRDLTTRIEGPAVRDVARLFLGLWARSGGSLTRATEIVRAVGKAGDTRVQVLGGAGRRGRRRLRRVHVALISEARERIVIANSYFAPDPGLRSALCRAARRGVRVDLLLAGISDVPIVRWAGRATYGSLLEAGVRIREMHHAILHAKMATFDDELLLTGSANLDSRSFRHNLEIAVNVFDREAAAAAIAAFAPDGQRAVEVTLDEWRRRSVVDRLLERLASLWSYWL